LGGDKQKEGILIERSEGLEEEEEEEESSLFCSNSFEVAVRTTDSQSSRFRMEEGSINAPQAFFLSLVVGKQKRVNRDCK
jgi:hypothetical protein